MKKINLNSDIGEGFGAYNIGNDDAMLDIVQSANIACGFHAGDPNVMDRVVRMAAEKGVSIGAHPGFNDIWGFGRRRIYMPMEEIEASVAYQIGALQAIAISNNTAVTHVKPHGALNNMSSEIPEIAEAIAKAINAVDNQLIVVAVAGSHLFTSGRNLGLNLVAEAYADRTYEEDGNMTNRKYDHAMIRDPEQAVEQVRQLILEGVIVANNGVKIPTEVDTICIHGDEPTGPSIAEAIRKMLKDEGVELVTLPQLYLN
ncbi:MAG: hypothetical protein CMM58_06435 [Rhodospirillaceae bacterium]|nr:hypothetical protein [Rhodospirillaceae bacterium]|tara:strand:- start:1311 stop:2084 length:774 start_codon:yes stop_codon:yes gene_type:complete